MNAPAARPLSLFITAVVCLAASLAGLAVARAPKREIRAGLQSSTTSLPGDFSCDLEVRLYDPVELSSIRIRSVPGDECVSEIPGVTVRKEVLTQRTVLENFPPGFRGPAALLLCRQDFHHSECASTPAEYDGFVRAEDARDADGGSIAAPAVCVSRIDCDRWACIQDGPTVADVCGDPDRSGSIGATDALFVLTAAVSGGNCPAAQCDTDRDGAIDATDALRVLGAGIGLDTELLCPAPCTATPPGEVP